MNTVIVIWGLIDRNVINDVERINEKLKVVCIGKGFTFIDSNNIKEFCLNRCKLHFVSPSKQFKKIFRIVMRI